MSDLFRRIAGADWRRAGILLERCSPPGAADWLGPCPERAGRPRFPAVGWLCYKRGAVKAIWKQEATVAELQGTAKAPVSTVPAAAEAPPGGEHASTYCPVCSQRLESRRCKLVCNTCGYYMSCADYY